MSDDRIKKPIKGTWVQVIAPPMPGEKLLAFENPFGVLVFSSVAITEERKEEWHISISEFRRYPSESVKQWVKECFEIQDFEEDNHSAKKIASFWKPMVKDLEGECPCKDEPS